MAGAKLFYVVSWRFRYYAGGILVVYVTVGFPRLIRVLHLAKEMRMCVLL